jgi:hypothetical protein
MTILCKTSKSTISKSENNYILGNITATAHSSSPWTITNALQAIPYALIAHDVLINDADITDVRVHSALTNVSFLESLRTHSKRAIVKNPDVFKDAYIENGVTVLNEDLVAYDDVVFIRNFKDMQLDYSYIFYLLGYYVANYSVTKSEEVKQHIDRIKWLVEAYSLINGRVTGVKFKGPAFIKATEVHLEDELGVGTTYTLDDLNSLPEDSLAEFTLIYPKFTQDTVVLSTKTVNNAHRDIIINSVPAIKNFATNKTTPFGIVGALCITNGFTKINVYESLKAFTKANVIFGKVAISCASQALKPVLEKAPTIAVSNNYVALPTVAKLLPSLFGNGAYTLGSLRCEHKQTLYVAATLAAFAASADVNYLVGSVFASAEDMVFYNKLAIELGWLNVR